MGAACNKPPATSGFWFLMKAAPSSLSLLPHLPIQPVPFPHSDQEGLTWKSWHQKLPSLFPSPCQNQTETTKNVCLQHLLDSLSLKSTLPASHLGSFYNMVPTLFSSTEGPEFTMSSPSVLLLFFSLECPALLVFVSGPYSNPITKLPPPQCLSQHNWSSSCFLPPQPSLPSTLL